MTKKEKENDLIKSFVESTIQKVKASIKKDGSCETLLFVLVYDKTDKDYEVIVERLPKVSELGTSEDVEIHKAVAIGLAVKLFFKFVESQEKKLIYMVHTETVEINDEEVLTIYEKDLRSNKKDETNFTCFDIKRGKMKVNEDGVILKQNITFVEANH